jgi:hypothetical protein
MYHTVPSSAIAIWENFYIVIRFSVLLMDHGKCRCTASYLPMTLDPTISQGYCTTQGVFTGANCSREGTGVIFLHNIHYFNIKICTAQTGGRLGCVGGGRVHIFCTTVH